MIFKYYYTIYINIVKKEILSFHKGRQFNNFVSYFTGGKQIKAKFNCDSLKFSTNIYKHTVTQFFAEHSY